MEVIELTEQTQHTLKLNFIQNVSLKYNKIIRIKSLSCLEKNFFAQIHLHWWDMYSFYYYQSAQDDVFSPV